MKLSFIQKIIPSQSLITQVIWNVLSQNIVNTNVFYVFFAIKNIVLIILALRFSILKDQFQYVLDQWQLSDSVSNSGSSSSAGSQQIVAIFINFGIGITVLQLTTIFLFGYCLNYFRKHKGAFHTAYMLIIFKFTGFIFTIQNSAMINVISITSIAPLTQLKHYDNNAMKYQCALSCFMILMQSTSFYCFHKFYILRYQNDLIPWSQPKHIVTFLDFIRSYLMVVFCMIYSDNRLINALFETILFVLSSVNVFIEIQKPYFYIKMLAILKLNVDGILSCYFFANILWSLMDFDSNGYTALQILSVITIVSLLNFINIKYKEKLIADMLNNKMANPSQCELTVYYLLEMLLQKPGSHQSNQYDAIIHSSEMDADHFSTFSGFKRNNNAPIRPMTQSLKLQKIYQNQVLQQLSADDSNRYQTNKESSDQDLLAHLGAACTSFSVVSGIDNQFSLQLSHQNENTTSNLYMEPMNHQLQECFNHEMVSQQRLAELDSNKKSEQHQMVQEKIHREDLLKHEKLSYLVDNVLKPYQKMNPDNIPLMFIRCYLSLIHQKNRFICLTVITAIENLNKKQKYVDQVENKISQQYLLEICKIEQQMASDSVDSTIFLDLNLIINDYLDLLGKASRHINEFWSILYSQNDSSEIMKLEKLSLQISEILSKIKMTINKIEDETQLQSVSQQVLFYSATFYQMTLRDLYLSDFFFRQIAQQNALKQISNIKSNLANFDEVCLAIVDGNFQYMGRILYGNKVVLKQLGYKAEEIIGQTVHVLMPKDIAYQHDKFWNRFKDSGVPSILEQQRFLYMKDKKGYIFPYQIFVKFIYHQRYGYAFLGLMKKSKTVAINEIERPIKVSNFFFFICNKSGKITEISQTCEKFLGLNSLSFQQLDQYLQEGLNLYHFNKNLQISQMDFSKNSCILINKVSISTYIVFEHMKELEIEIDLTQKSKIKPTLQVSLKIVKESYGFNDVSLYYVMFTMIRETVTSSLKQSVFEKMVQKIATYDQYSISDDDKNVIAESIEAKSIKSYSSSNLHNDSQSCTQSSITSNSQNQFDELKYLEENIDYSKTPKSLMIVKIIYNSIIAMIIALTISLVVLNQVQINSQIEQLQIVSLCSQNMVQLSQLSVLTRSYINMQLGLEPMKTNFIENRLELVKSQAEDIIEQMRIRQRQIDLRDKIEGEHSIIEITEKLLNGSLYVYSSKFNYVFNSYLIKAQEIYNYEKVSSKEMTYLQKHDGKSLSNQDLTLYYFITNTIGNIKLYMDKNLEHEAQNVSEKSTEDLQVSKIFMIIASCTIFLGILAALYFYSKIIDNQSRTLAFFSELPKEMILYCMQGSQDFCRYLLTENNLILSNDSTEIQKRKDAKLFGQDSNQNNGKSKLVSEQDQRKQTTMQTQAQNFETSDKLKIGKIQRKIIEEFKDEDDNEEYKSHDHTKKGYIASKFTKSSKSKDQKSDLKRHKSKLGSKLDEDIWEKGSNDDDTNNDKKKKTKSKRQDREKSYRLSEVDNEKINFNSAINDRLNHTLMQYKIKKMGLNGVLFLVLASVFVSYFIIQFLILERITTYMETHSHNLQLLHKGQSCMNWFMSNLREMQIQNSSQSFLQYNQTYDECSKVNQQFSLWLSSEVDTDQLITLNKKLSYNNQICPLIVDNYSQEVRLENCEDIYQGILKKPLFQIVSLFLHDTFQSYIQFLSYSGKSESYLNKTIALPQLIELMDTQQHYMSKIRDLIHLSLHDSLTQSESTLKQQQLYVFGVYFFLLVASLIILNCFVFTNMRKQIWNSKIIFKLLPIEELDLGLKRRIQIFLNKL